PPPRRLTAKLVGSGGSKAGAGAPAPKPSTPAEEFAPYKPADAVTSANKERFRIATRIHEIDAQLKRPGLSKSKRDALNKERAGLVKSLDFLGPVGTVPEASPAPAPAVPADTGGVVDTGGDAGGDQPSEPDPALQQINETLKAQLDLMTEARNDAQ